MLGLPRRIISQSSGDNAAQDLDVDLRQFRDGYLLCQIHFRTSADLSVVANTPLGALVRIDYDGVPVFSELISTSGITSPAFAFVIGGPRGLSNTQSVTADGSESVPPDKLGVPKIVRIHVDAAGAGLDSLIRTYGVPVTE